MADRVRVLLGIAEGELLASAAALIDESDEIELAATARDAEGVSSALAGAEIDVVVVHESLTALPIMDLVRQLAAEHPGAAMVVMAREETPQGLRAALQAGARDVVAQPLTLERLSTAIVGASRWASAVRGQIEADREARIAGGQSGRVIAVAGGKGGVGTTTLALHLALAAAAEEGSPPCLVELDLQGGDLRALLDLPQSDLRTISDLIPLAGEVSRRGLEDVLYVHRSGLRVLLAPERGEDAEDIPDGLSRETIGALRAMAQVVIVDLGSQVSEAAAAAAELADVILVSVTPDVPAIRGANRLLKMWERLGIDSAAVRIVLNRVSRGAEIQRELASKVLNAELADGAVPAGFRDLEGALNSGDPTSLASGSVREAIGTLAVEFGAATPKPRRSRRRRTGGEDSEADAEGAQGERGQVSVETAGLVSLIAVIVLFMWQIVLTGYTAVLAGHSAREGARALAVGDEGEKAARDDVPGAWREGMDYKEETESGEPAYSKVTLRVPAVVPGLDTPIEISADESTVIEAEPLPEEFTG